METLVFWGAELLPTAAKVVMYHDWTLDLEGPDGSYIEARSMEARVGKSYTQRTIEQTRNWLKHLGLYLKVDRSEPGSVKPLNPGWLVVFPPECRNPRTYRDVPKHSRLLDEYIAKRLAWLDRKRDSGGATTTDADPPLSQLQGDPSRNSGPSSRAARVRGEGGSASLAVDAHGDMPLPPVVTEPERQGRDGAFAPKGERRGGGPQPLSEVVPEVLRRARGGQ